ncbi:MAG: VCBS repeat-containing protein [Acidobacteria bacterium]|nr:VCBS repeat-containing protein [Acidobacteriota bacterium]
MRRLKLFVFLSFVSLALILVARPFRFAAAERLSVAAAPVAPRGVAASDDDYIDKVSVMWSAVRGATLYRVYRGTDPAAVAPVGTTAGNYFFDTTAVVGQTYFYRVGAENASGASALSPADQGRRAAGQFQSGIFSPLAPPPVPANNPLTAAKAALGKVLFWDEQLSSTRTVACGTCHRPAAGGSDPRTLASDPRSLNPGFDNIFGTADDVAASPGVPANNADGSYSFSSVYGLREQVTPRKSPSYLNSGFAFNGIFWDGRASNVFRDPLTNAILINDWGTLESQSLGPPVSTGEMGHAGRSLSDVAARIAGVKPLALASNIPPALAAWIDNRTYPQLFEEAFGTPDVTPARIALAIGTHERTLFSDRAPFDRWAMDLEPLTAAEDRGMQIFVNANCNFCHGGPALSDQNFHNVGVRPQNEDTGRGAVSGNNNDNGRFKTPSLRNLELRAPYMHNGRFATVEDVVEFYNRGGDFSAPNKDPRVRPLNLTAAQKADLVAFLKRPLTDQRVRDERAPFDRPHLYTESNRVPAITGTGRAGTGGFTPQPVALEPPLLGNPSFTVAVSGALGGAPAVLVVDAADPGAGASVPATGSFARVALNLSGSGGGAGYGSATLAIPDDPLLIGRTLYGRWYVTDAAAANGFSVSPAFRLTVFGAAATTAPRPPADFDGDGQTDVSIFRPPVGEWWYANSSDNTVRAAQFGASGDLIAPADYTGDGRTDIAIWRPGTGEWFVLRSEDGSYYSYPFGAAGDVPAPADFDGDGRADTAVFRPGTGEWFIRRSSDGGATIGQFGQSGDIPVAADYDGDGRADLAVYRASTGDWWIARSAAGVLAFRFGTATDRPVAGDYTGDGKADAAFWRPGSGEWFILRSEDGSFFSFPFGAPGDLPAVGDYDGDGKFDPAVFRPSDSNWYVQRSAAGLLIARFGQTGDQPAR